ncbi:MAG: valine--tRNA ligase [Gammaproteobacteria bacterium]|nr:valine--tRNA ligase [Gammaproteobacteria bacterium]
MNKTFDPTALEFACYSRWEQEGYFSPNHTKDSFCIMLPPPNVTGYLHMGHGFQQTLMDILIRKHRMEGKNTLWQGGTDHAGIATQMVVERQLQEKGQSKQDLGREKFIDTVLKWKKLSGGQITQQIRRLGASIDWSRERFTMDEGMSEAVRDVFIRLYEEGLIYRGKRLVNWDPKLQTAISDLEVLNEEEDGTLYHIAYSLTDDPTNRLIVATTRPETLFGDVAVAVNPNDIRYQYLIGKTLQLPLTQRCIPIIADDYVDPRFGSGCVKITPAHDFNDYAIGERHSLACINILTKTGHLNEHVPEPYRALSVLDARKKVVDDLSASQQLIKQEKHTMKVPRGDRSGVIIEPLLTDQWYVSMKNLAEPAMNVVRNGQIKIVPEHWSKTYFQWLENIQDWCISRQLWWGHRIPAWYDVNGKLYVGHNEQEIRDKYKLDKEIILTQDEDVLDTWFSSALWPFSTLGWPTQTKDLSDFYPSQILMTGFDILFFWVARMVMMGLHFMKEIPFHTIYITGLIRDAEGQKMSKSKGNVLDPIDLIDGISLEDLIKKRTQSMMQPQLAEKIADQTRQQFPNGIPSSGCDALRFTFCALASHTNNIRFDMTRLEGYRNFCNKLWNAARYVFMNVNDQPGITIEKYSVIDEWITTRLQYVIQETNRHYEQLRFDLLAQCLYDFVWNEFCDWYVELSKPVLWQDCFSAEEKAGTRHTLMSTLETILRLLHPIIPFITETIWQHTKRVLPSSEPSLMLAEYPTFKKNLIHEESEADVEWIKKIIVAIRTIRSEMNVSPALTISVYLRKGNVQDKERFSRNKTLLMTLAKLNDIGFLEEHEKLPPSATGLAGELDICIPLKGIIDVKAELARLTKEIEKRQQDAHKISDKLNNPTFLTKAPESVVNKEKEKLTALEKILPNLTQPIIQSSVL